MATRGFLPISDGGLLAWAQNFSTKITAAPTTYGLTSTLATSFAAKVTAYQTAMTANEPGVRSKASVATKNVARLALREQANQLSKLVQGTATVTDAQKLELGLNVRATPTPRPVPSEAPALDVRAISGNTLTVRLHDASSSSKRGKPAGVAGATLFSYVGATPPTTSVGWHFEGSTTRTVVEVAFDESLPIGTKVWLSAFWTNERNLSGPACEPVPATLVGGAALPSGSSTLKIAA